MESDNIEEALGSPARKKAKIKPSERGIASELLNRITSCDFYLTVSTAETSPYKIGTVSFVLSGETKPDVLPEAQKCWIYVKEAFGDDQDEVILYYEWSHSKTDCSKCLNEISDSEDIGVHTDHYDVSASPPYHLLQALRIEAHFSLQFERYDRGTGQLDIGVWLPVKTSVFGVAHPSDMCVSAIRKDVLLIMAHFYHIENREAVISKPSRKSTDREIDALYEKVRQFHKREASSQGAVSFVDSRHQNLVPSLRQYQIEAVRWMVRRERRPDSLFSSSDLYYKLFVSVKLISGQTLYYNRYGGYFVSQKPLANDLLPGGILADEMGLGKTVEVLACLLANPRPTEGPLIKTRESLPDFSITDSVPKEHRPVFGCICGKEFPKKNDKIVQCSQCGLRQHLHCVNFEDDSFGSPYYCAHCWLTQPLCASRATLIVSPATICHQWLEEIRRHVSPGSLKVFLYEGVRLSGFIQPHVLADHDIVMVTYNTLKQEVNYLDLPHSNSDAGRKFRNPKRFMAIPTPLLAIHWWRVCLDEAQLVECPMAKTATMALRLSAVNRWCITGTPIQRSVSDLFGLLLFLGVDPYCVPVWWNKCLYEPYLFGNRDEMYDVISKVLWRTAKKDVLDQINIPRQTEEINWLSFAPIEEHFYKRQHADISNKLMYRLSSFGDLNFNLNTLDKHIRNKLMLPLLNLRQACCHPQVVQGKYAIPVSKPTLSKQDLLDVQTRRATIECEEAQRQLVSVYNGLAGLDILEDNFESAANNYRTVLSEWKRMNALEIDTDRLQLLHTFHNLNEVLIYSDVEKTEDENEGALQNQAESLRKNYLKDHIAKISDSRNALKQIVAKVEEIQQTFVCTGDAPWWICLLTWAEKFNYDVELTAKIQNDLVDCTGTSVAGGKHSMGSMVEKYCNIRTIKGLQLLLTNQMDDVEEARRELVDAVQKLEDQPSNDVINKAADCHLRPCGGARCDFCEVFDFFMTYESRLYSSKDIAGPEPTSKEEALLTRKNKGTWGVSGLEQVMKILLNFARQKNGSEYLADGKLQLELFKAQKDEFKCLRALWMNLRNQTSALDELNMATNRFRLRRDYEQDAGRLPLNVIADFEIPAQRRKIENDKITADKERENAVGQLLYLRNLAKTEFWKGGESTTEPCPICKAELGRQYSVLHCGHCMCMDCVQEVMSRASFGQHSKRSISCPICRRVTFHQDISFVDSVGSSADEKQIEIKGNYSTKVESILRKILMIRQLEPEAKTLVFSTWINLLDVLAIAFRENNISHLLLTISRKYENVLNSFRHDPDVRVLLLPFRSGANGLNLIEATHVILVEPSLNPALEWQAIGRIHRIGQTRKTVVHRFLIRRTIEEKIHALFAYDQRPVEEKNFNTEDDGITAKTLSELFAED